MLVHFSFADHRMMVKSDGYVLRYLETFKTQEVLMRFHNSAHVCSAGTLHRKRLYTTISAMTTISSPSSLASPITKIGPYICHQAAVLLQI